MRSRTGLIETHGPGRLETRMMLVGATSLDYLDLGETRRPEPELPAPRPSSAEPAAERDRSGDAPAAPGTASASA